MNFATAVCVSLFCIGICSAADGGTSPPLACNMRAISAADRPRYNDLMKRLRSAVRNRSELTDGYVYKLDSKPMALAEVAEWITMERLCCPFLTFQLDVKGLDGTAQLTLRGPVGTKAILQEEFPQK
jgi:hypothetical protein